MALKGELERYEEWRSEFSMRDDGVDTFRRLEKLRRIDSTVWGDSDWSDSEKLVKISEVLSE